MHTHENCNMHLKLQQSNIFLMRNELPLHARGGRQGAHKKLRDPMIAYV